MKKHNFGAGPGILPQEALKQSAAAVLELNNIGLSLLEISHRSKDFTEIIDSAKTHVKELLGVPDSHSILFLQGGASLQFAMVPMNLLPENGTAGYVQTGVWAKKAAKEAAMIGNTTILASSEDRNYTYIPKGYDIPSDLSYLHLTSNNTIYGTQLKDYPYDSVPLVCDMSSDIFSKRVDVSKFDLIYAGAQKNMGPAGTTLVIVRNEVLERSGRKIPTMLNYKTHVDNDSLFNTPPVFAIYVCLKTLEWVKGLGGVDAINQMNTRKAELLYNEIDSNPMFKGTAEVEDRSLMNVCFLMNKPELEEEFMNATKEAGVIGIKGHRSVGGFRASIYNALPIESVEVLVNVMKEFALKTA
jgi:phosphoserine aminotransferase